MKYELRWGDAAAAAFISVEIVMEGWENTREVIRDLMDESPSVPGETSLSDLPDKVRARAESLPWVEEAAVRLREQGRIMSGEVYLVPKNNGMSDWRLHGLTLTPVKEISSHDPPRL